MQLNNTYNHFSKLEVIIMAMTGEDYEWNRQWNLRVFGKASDIGCYYRRWRKKYERDLTEAESWLRTNPSNPIWQANVARLKKKVEEFRKSEDECP